MDEVWMVTGITMNDNDDRDETILIRAFRTEREANAFRDFMLTDLCGIPGVRVPDPVFVVPVAFGSMEGDNLMAVGIITGRDTGPLPVPAPKAEPEPSMRIIPASMRRSSLKQPDIPEYGGADRNHHCRFPRCNHALAVHNGVTGCNMIGCKCMATVSEARP